MISIISELCSFEVAMCNIFVEKYKSFSDVQLIELARNNNQDAFETLFYRYLPLIKKLVSSITVAGSDYEDLLQDSTISFYYAVQMYDEQLASFATFLSVCVNRSLKSTIRRASAQKRIPEELFTNIDDNSVEVLKTVSAEEEFFGVQSASDTSNEIRTKLSDLEFKVLRSFLNTESYDKTAAELAISRKTVDNALVRIRKKLNS